MVINIIRIANILWKRGVCCSFNYKTFLAPCIQCTHHLCDPGRFADINLQVTALLGETILNENSCWSTVTSSIYNMPLAIATSKWPMVPRVFFGRFLITMAFGQWVTVIMKYMPALPTVLCFIIGRICGAMNNVFWPACSGGAARELCTVLALN